MERLKRQLQIAEMYGLGRSASNENLIIQGWQDNGTNKYTGTGWTKILGGDGMLCFIDWNNDQNMWASITMEHSKNQQTVEIVFQAQHPVLQKPEHR